jgi:hypothetical protein
MRQVRQTRSEDHLRGRVIFAFNLNLMNPSRTSNSNHWQLQLEVANLRVRIMFRGTRTVSFLLERGLRFRFQPSSPLASWFPSLRA